MLETNKDSTTATASTLPEQTTVTQLRETIYGMKLRLQQKPPDIDQQDWDSVIITGKTSREFVTLNYRDQLVQQAAVQMQNLPHDTKEQIKALSSIALDKLLEVMDDVQSKPSDKLAAATFLLDHTVGKAKQEVEHSGSLALEIRAQARKALELESKMGMRDITPQENSDKPKSAVKDFLEQHSVDDYIVGEKETIVDGNENI